MALVEKDHGSAELLKEPAQPPRLEYFKYFAIRETLRIVVPAPMDAERVCSAAFDLVLRLGYPIYNPFLISEVR